jgi:hypothetical protein
MYRQSSLTCLVTSWLLLAGCSAGGDPKPSDAGRGGAGGVSIGGSGEGGDGGSFHLPGPTCPSPITGPCIVPDEPAHTMLFDVASLPVPAHVVGLSTRGALIAREPEPGVSELALARVSVFTESPEIVPVLAPHEPDLEAAAMTSVYFVLCGASACRLYEDTPAGVQDAQAPDLPMARSEIEGATVVGNMPCVFGADVVCLFGEDWHRPAPLDSDRLLATTDPYGPDHILGGEAGRMGRLTQYPDENGTPMPSWQELPRLTGATLRAGAGSPEWGQLAGDDGVVVRLGADDQRLLCDTGDESWRFAAEYRVISDTETLYRRDPQVPMSDDCVRSDAAAPSYRFVSSWQEGTVWGIYFATETQVFVEVTGATE